MEFKQDVNDRRTGVRLNFQVRVTIFPDSGNGRVEGVSSNVSVTGILVHTAAALPARYINRPCKLSIHFPGTHSNLVIQDLKGKTARIDDKDTAISFDKPLEWFLLFPVYQRRLETSQH